MNYASSIIASAAFLLSFNTANASDIFIGRRGPTSVQIDSRVQVSHADPTLASSQQLIIKYWTGEDRGVFSYVSLGSKEVISPKKAVDLGDLVIGVGPRGHTGNLHVISSVSGFMSLQKSKELPDLGATMFATYLLPEQSIDIDVSASYRATSIRKDVPDKISSGVVVGKKINDGVHLAGGVSSNGITSGAAHLALLGIGRYTFSSKMHMEAIGSVGVISHNLPLTKELNLIVRYNVGEKQ